MQPTRNDGIARSTAGIVAPGPMHERILQVLGMTVRPLGSSELEGALGLVTSEARSACRWLTDHGYITSSAGIGKAAAQKAMTFWSLADKGRAWVKHSVTAPVTASVTTQ